ncbi:ORF033R [giant sea perch iridovirus - K1]|uniref:ORF033R n=1 Tax=Giant seaperch iridovirus TaxID=176655 RepID=A0A140GB34_GSIV|nr:ORF033R [giant sea perch iridovirus - K1]
MTSCASSMCPKWPGHVTESHVTQRWSYTGSSSDGNINGPSLGSYKAPGSCFSAALVISTTDVFRTSSAVYIPNTKRPISMVAQMR